MGHQIEYIVVVVVIIIKGLSQKYSSTKVKYGLRLRRSATGGDPGGGGDAHADDGQTVGAYRHPSLNCL